MLIYDTLSGEKKKLEQTKDRINLFVCGPTVYDYSHIGHARTYIFFDLFVKYLRSLGYKIFYLQNITDIDDRIIVRAKERSTEVQKLAKEFTDKYLEDMKALGVTEVDKYAPATKFIKQIVGQVKTLIDKGYAYKTSDGYYFDISKFEDYGKLSRRSAEQAESAVSRIDESVTKNNKGDFALWKFYKEGEPFWETELGKGRPGWHIEDTAITEKYFGPQYDIHGGGIDLKFPHHEAELAQQESASGKSPFVKIWMHSGFLLADGKKMSKSLNNFITIGDFLTKHDPLVLKWIVLTHHYRSPVNYTESLISQSISAINGLRESLAKLGFASNKSNKDSSFDLQEKLKNVVIEFESALSDDFNTPLAIAVILSFLGDINDKIWNLSKIEAKSILKIIKNTLSVFSIELKADAIPLNIKKFIDEREEFRRNKQFIQSDALRKKTEDLGYIIEDTPFGPFIIKTNAIN
ncbi:MAG TPA: cysteine--tRNA ligase [Candidatus Paceibacterota bacterium]